MLSRPEDQDQVQGSVEPYLFERIECDYCDGNGVVEVDYCDFIDCIRCYGFGSRLV